MQLPVLRQLSSTTSTKLPKIIPPVRKSVIVSSSNDIYANLALEHWIYKNVPFTEENRRHLLMLWVNEPCVVIGRHQNPWTECDVRHLETSGVALARRNSGGGCVYHDDGNLNLTFFTPAAHYNRRYNLDFIAAAIFKDYTLKVDVNKREDLIVRERKVSGTAAKVARHAAYHHCTLLVDANLENLRKSLGLGAWEIQSKATKSLRTKILNLHEEQPKITVASLTQSLAKRYLQYNNLNWKGAEGNSDQDSTAEQSPKDLRQVLENFENRIDFESQHVQYVEPKEEHFPGLDAITDEYKSWQWVFGTTPKFTASKVFFRHFNDSDIDLQENDDLNNPILYSKGQTFALRLNISVENGLVSDLDLMVPQDFPQNDPVHQKLQEMQSIVGEKYTTTLLRRLECAFRNVVEDKTCLLRNNTHQTSVQ